MDGNLHDGRRAGRRRHSARVYRRRRAVALGLVLGLGFAVRPAGAALTGLGGPHAAPLAVPVVRHVVEPGESFWSIARELEPDRDPRSVVYDLRQALGSACLVPGQVIEWAG